VGGIGLQATGVAGWASAYFHPTDPSVETSVGSAVIEAANNDQGHLFAFLIPGALLVVLGTVLQCVGLFRAHVAPVWVPIALLFTVITFIVPGNGVLGLITTIPMAVGAIGLGYYAWLSLARDEAQDGPRNRHRVPLTDAPWRTRRPGPATASVSSTSTSPRIAQRLREGD